jgi:drug/metabolite transporter (DMT)-like permease
VSAALATTAAKAVTSSTQAGLVPTLITLALWSSTAPLTLIVTGLPPAMVVAVTFIIAGLVCLPFVRHWRVPLRTFLMVSLCCVSYRLVFVEALQMSPHVETNLIFGLNTVLIVVLSPWALPNSRLKTHHVLGVLIGAAGVILAVGHGRIRPTFSDLPAYAFALYGSVLWALYSLALKRLPPAPSTSMGGSLLAAGIMSALLMLLLPAPAASAPSAAQWLALTLLSVGPTAVAYMTWDMAMKRGDPRVVASLMNLGPLTSTILIVLINHQHMTWPLLLGAVVVVCGSFIGSWELFRGWLRPAAHGQALVATTPVPVPALVVQMVAEKPSDQACA